MKEKFGEVGTIVWYTLVFLLVVLILTAGTMAINGTLYPWLLSFQRKSVEQSKSFVDANNNMLQTYMLEYSRLDTKIAEAQSDPAISGAYKAQQKAVIGRMCTEISTMDKSTVNPSTLSWLNSQGGCR